jgi:hypothetical protein
MNKEIRDIGIAAYLVMHEFKLHDKREKNFIFSIDPNDQKKFEDLKISYLSSEFHHFDSCIMSLKKLEEYAFELGSDFFTNDLGCAAYLLMHKFRLLGKKHRYFYFEISSEEEETQFREIMIQYSGSEFHSFDSKLMSLKKII